MQAQTNHDEPYKYHPVIRHITNENVHKHGVWAVVIHTMIMNARRAMRRWEEAAFDAAHAAGAKGLDESDDPIAVRTLSALRRYRRDVDRLEMMLALEVAKRDMAHLDDEIVSCFKKDTAHMEETIVRRLFKSGPCSIDYGWTRFVQKRLARMRKAGRLATNYGFGREQTKWYVVTPKVIADRKAAKERRAKEEAKRKVRQAREKAVVAFLEEKGIRATAEYGQVTLNLKAMETLLGLTGK